MDGKRPDLPELTLAKWQRVVDLIARLAEVPASLIMRTEPPQHAVAVASTTEPHPYRIGQEFALKENLYCYGVIRADDELVVEDARAEPAWADNEDLDYGMSFYIGYPLKWPDGGLFGTICVLDRARNERALLFREGLREFSRVIEADLALLVEVAARKELERQLTATLSELESRVAERTQALEEANTALRVLIANLETSRQDYEAQILRQIKGLVLPHLSKLRLSLGGRQPQQTYLELLDDNLRGITSSLAERAVSAFESLTPTEIEIAQLVMNGRTTKEIASTLSRETSTIDFHRNNIRRKLGLRDRRRNLRSHLLSLQ